MRPGPIGRRSQSRRASVIDGCAAFLVAVALVGGGMLGSCAPEADPTAAAREVGSVGLAVRLSQDVDLTRVDFEISGNGITPVSGRIDVANAAAIPSQFHGGLPAGNGYLVRLTATSTDGRITCVGSAGFDVVPGAATSVNVILQCRAAPPDAGTVVVVGGVNNCPSFTSIVVSPASVPLGGNIAVAAVAVDIDSGDTVSFAWIATAGSFANASAAQTTFACSDSGSQTLTVTVSDGRCSDGVDVGVACVPPRCGNGVIDSVEECDPPNGNTCDSSCQRIPICGDGITEKTEQCDPPNGTTCDANCKTISAGGTGEDGGSTG
jgi:hypothetical protein